ncbi:prolyl oligopeptidase [Syncephalis plumigaleata]|nr:prolyl oligopeptidase [Syncephalis plumigaleata]
MLYYRNTSRLVVLAYFAVLIGSAVPLHALPASQSEQVPVAKTKPFQHKYHGEVIDDPYQWIKDEGRNSTDVKEYLNAEKVYAQQVLAKDQQLKDQIRNEMVKIRGQSPTAFSQYSGNYHYYSKRQPATKSFVYYRKKIDVANAPEELILDPSTLPEGSRGVVDTRSNSDHTLFAFTTYNPTSGKHNLIIKNLNSKQILPDKIENTDSMIEWSGTGKSILYTANDPNGARLMRHTIGTPVDKDSAIHTGQKGFYISVKKSSSNRYFFITISKENVEPQYFYLDATNDTASKMVPIPVTLSPGSYLELHHLNKQFLLVVASKSTMKKTAYVCDIDKINDKSAHKPILENVKLKTTSIATFRNHIAIFDEVVVPQQVTIYDYDSEGRLQPNAKSHNIEFPAKSYKAAYRGVADYNSNTIIFEYSSLITPPTTYSYNMATKKATKTYVNPVTDYNESNYVTELIYAKGKPDSKGNQPNIPITIAYKRGMQKNGANPAWVLGDDGGAPMFEVDFRAEFVSLLNRGFVCVVVHARRTEDPDLIASNIFTAINDRQALIDDFMSATNTLVSEKYTSRNLMVVEGISDGAAIVGAALNKQPDIAKVAVLYRPYLNVLNRMMEQSANAGSGYVLKGNNPAKSMDDYKAIKSYSPYENIKPNVAYPNIAVINYSDDIFTPYWDGAKWVAKLRATAARNAKSNTDPRTIVMLEQDDKKQDDSHLDQDAAKIAYAIGKLGKGIKLLNSA